MPPMHTVGMSEVGCPKADNEPNMRRRPVVPMMDLVLGFLYGVPLVSDLSCTAGNKHAHVGVVKMVPMPR